MKWPWPIQKVGKSDNRIRILEDTEEQTLTHDSKSLIVVTYCPTPQEQEEVYDEIHAICDG